MERYNIEKDGFVWVVDNSIYPEQGYYIESDFEGMYKI